MRHLLFIPVYNCENQIIRVLDKINNSECIKFFDEILIIDNRSQDQTIENIKKILEELSCKKFSLYQNDQNYNLGGTHKVAFNYAIENNYDYVSILHGDDQGDIDDLVKIFDDGKYINYDCILGSRFASKSKLINYPKFRIYANYLINLAASIVTFRFLTDLGSGINMFKVSYLKNKFYLDFPNDLTFNYCLIFYICMSKAKFFYFPITWREDDQLSNVKLFSHAVRWSKILFSYIFNKKMLFKNINLRELGYSFKKLFS
tara:strand:+ start:1662 stop:2441 length:780 start_codon:yes stop_codon:yes gene_type:complete